MPNKRGQVAVFVIIGILVVSLSVLVIYLDGIKIFVADEATGLEEIKEVKSFFETCMADTAEDALFYIGLHGGYYHVQEPYEMYLSEAIPYYFYLGNSSFPNKGVIEDEISAYIANNLMGCLEFSEYEKEGYKFQIGDLRVETDIADRIDIDITLPAKIEKENITGSFEEFNIPLDFDFDEVYNAVESFIKEQEKDAGSMPLIYLAELAEEKEFEFKVVQIEENKLIYFLLYNNALRDDKFIYAFAIKYLGVEE